MHTKRRVTTASLALIALAATGASLGSGPAVAARPAGMPGLAWTACGPQLQCSDVTVPLDWGEPHGRSLTLPVIRHLAGSPATRIGSLFVQPGGPGDSAVETVQTRGAALDAMTGGRFDIVGWDIRGAGGSARVSCFESQEDRAAFWTGTVLPTTAAERRAYLTTTAEFSRRCGARKR